MYECLVDDDFLITILAGSLILMLANAFFQEVRHFEMRIAEQCRNAHDG